MNMEAKYDIKAIMEALKAKEEMNADTHDGCYQLMRCTVEAYGKLGDYSGLDYRDLDLVYQTTIGTWKQNIEAKKKTIKESHLKEEDKSALMALWDDTLQKTIEGKYNNNVDGKSTIGLFGTGFFSFVSNNTTKESVVNFIHMCVDILPMTDDNAIYERAAQVLSTPIKGMGAAVASMILHCLKPCSFPVLNNNMGNPIVFEILGVQLIKPQKSVTYIENCKRIAAFRNKNFAYKNYRIFDLMSLNLSRFKSIQKVWLIAWNKENYQWNNYAELCERTKHGDTYVESWAFANTQVQVGEEVFLIKLGTHPKGIIAHGVIERDIYEKEHYNPQKALEGKKEKCVDVRFDRILNYETEPILTQDELVKTCNMQHWSPQNSGIEIASEVVPTVKDLWKAVITGREEWWPSLEEYEPKFLAEDYYCLFLDENIIDRSWLGALYEMYMMPEHTATCKQMGSKYGYNPSHYISYLSSIATNIVRKTNCEIPTFEEKNKFWPVLFQGKQTVDKSQGNYCWKMRENVCRAVEMLLDNNIIDSDEVKIMKQNNLNTILYGPPGTGKTYKTIVYAVAVCDKRPYEEVEKEDYSQTLKRYRELKEAGRIEFITFHQSYGYEEFIEGIKPELATGSDTIRYKMEDGRFKVFCNRAKAVKVQTDGDIKLKEQPRIWGMILGGTGMTALKQECFANNEIRLGWTRVSDDDVQDDFTTDSVASWNAKHMIYDFINSMDIGDIVVIEKTNKSIDAIGVITGNYEYITNVDYPRSRKVKWLVKDIDEDMVKYLPKGRKQLSRFTLFAFDYIGMDAISEILKKYQAVTSIKVDHETEPYVFIIDEINRGNISKVFGELITLIESTKRAGAEEAMEAILPYSGEAFSVPNNVYIIGTMNTADRSIALIDTALRRRFKFIEMRPDPKVLEVMGIGIVEQDGVKLNIAKMLDVMNERIEYLYDREHTIGHAFFTKLKDNCSIETLASIFKNEIIPLLQEYFNEDYEKIQLVLGDNGKEEEYKFILDKEVKLKEIFNGNPDIDLPEKGYEVNLEAFLKLNSYKLIGKGL